MIYMQFSPFSNPQTAYNNLDNMNFYFSSGLKLCKQIPSETYLRRDPKVLGLIL